MNKEVLGIDIGGVIIDRVNDNTDTSFFGNNYLQTTAVDQSFETIKLLVKKRFGDRTYLVSKCGRNVEAKTLEWLAHHRFYEVTGVKLGNTRFCRERHEKAAICDDLHITHFVDDRLEVLSHLVNVEKLFLFQPRAGEVKKFASHLARVNQVDTWQEIGELLL